MEESSLNASRVQRLCLDATRSNVRSHQGRRYVDFSANAAER